MSFHKFIETVREHYGNKNAVFLPEGSRLKRGQKVRVFLHAKTEHQELERLIDGAAVGNKNKKGEHLIWVVINNRRWTVGARNTQILINW